MTKSHFESGDAPPLFKALGIPDTDNSAAELGYCRTIVQGHLAKHKNGNLDPEAVIVLHKLYVDIANGLRMDYAPVIEMLSEYYIKQRKDENNVT